MSLEIKTGYMTAAQIEELEKNKKNQIGGATNMTVSQVSGSPMPGLNIDTAIANSGKDIKVESPLQKPAITPYKETQNLSGFMASQPTQGTTTAVTDTGLKSFLEAERVRKKNFLKQTIKIASMNQPDRAAEIQRLSTEFNIPPSIVQDNLDQMKNQSKLMEIDFDTLEVDSPILADQLRNLSFASVAHDDLESLGAIEKAFKWFKEGVLEAPENMASGWKAGNSIYDLGILGTEIRDSGGDITPELQTQIDQLHEIMASNSGEGIAHSAAQIAGTMYEGTRDAFIESGAQSLAVAGGTYIATLPFQGPLAFTPGPEDLVAGAGAAATGTMAFVPSMTVNMMRNSYEIEGGISYIDLREMGATHENASNVSNVVGMVNASLEMVGITAVTKPWRKLWSGFVNKKINQSITRGGLAKDFFASYLLGIGVETFTEGTQEFVNILGEEFTKMIDEGVDVESLFATEEGMEELWGRLNEVMVTTAQGMVLLSLPGATTTYAAGHSQVSNAEKTTQLFEALSDGAANSTLIERLPSEGQKFVKEVLKESDANTVYIDHEKFNDYLNKRGIDPNSAEAKEFFQDLGIDGQLEELAVTGGDVAIPIEKYTTNIAPTDHHPDLAPHIRVNQEHWSASESENWLKNNPDFKSNVEAIQKEADRVSNLTDNERSQNLVYREVFNQLVNQGTSREDSNAQAVMYSAVFEVLGKEGNVDPAELFQRYGLDVQRIFPSQKQKDGTVKPTQTPQPQPEIFDMIEEVLNWKTWYEKPENQLYLETSNRWSEKFDEGNDSVRARQEKVKTIQAQIEDEYGEKLIADVENLETNIEIDESEIDAIIKEYGNEFEGFNENLRRGYSNGTNSFAEDYIDFVHNLKNRKIEENETLTKKEKNALLKRNENSREINKRKFDDKLPKAPTGDAVEQGATSQDALRNMPESLSHINWPLSWSITTKSIEGTWPTETVQNPFWKPVLDRVTNYISVDGETFFIDEIEDVNALVVLVNNKGEETIYTYWELEKLDLRNVPKPKKAFPKNKTETGKPGTKGYKTTLDKYNDIQKANSLPPIKSSGVLASDLAKMTLNQLVALADKLDLSYEAKPTKAMLIDRINRNQTNQKQAPLPPKKPGVPIPEPTIKYLVDKGGILGDSDLAADLKSQDVKRIGLIRKKGEGKGYATTGDNIPITEFREATGLNPPESAEDNSYVDINWLSNRLIEENAGTAGLSDEDQADLEAYERDLAAYEEELANFEKTTDDVNTELEDAQRADVDAMQYDMAEMTDFLENTLNIDLDNSTPEEIEALIQDQLYDPEGRILDQAAFHGTTLQEVFNKFSTDFIGTGEGAQAYGWGLYFASQEAVARHYAKDYSGNDFQITFADGTQETITTDNLSYDLISELNAVTDRSIIGQDVRGNAQTTDKQIQQTNLLLNNEEFLSTGSLDSVNAIIKEKFPSSIGNNNVFRWKRYAYGSNLEMNVSPSVIDDGEYWLSVAQGKAKNLTQDNKKQKIINHIVNQKELYEISLQNYNNKIDNFAKYRDTEIKEIEKKGALYKVDLKPAEEDYLIWDLGLNDQSNKVTKVINDLIKEHNLGQSGGFVNGRDVYKHIGYNTDLTGTKNFEIPKRTSQELLRRGVRGIKFADGNTRQSFYEGGKVDWNYVIFDAADVEITKTFNQSEIEPQGLREGEVMHFHSSPNIFDQFEINENRLGGTYPSGIYHHGTKARTTGYGDNTYRIAVELGKVGTYFPHTPKDVNQAMEDKYYELLMKATGDRGPSHKNWVRTEARKFRESGWMGGRLSGLEKREVWIAGGYDTIKDGQDYISFHPEAVRILEVNGKQAPPMREFFQSQQESELTLEEFIDAKQYQGTHRAPTSSYGAPGHDLTDGMYPDDVYGPNGNRYYGDNSAAGEQAMAHMHAMRGKPDYEITVYRAAPKDAKTINPGDWVTTVKSYADEHGFRQYDEGEYTVLSKKVKAKEIYTEGNSLFEWGYSPTERQSEFFQTVPIMDGREKLRKYGLDERKRNRNQDVALALQSRQRKKYGFIDFNDISKEAENKVAGWIAAEVRYKARQVDDQNSAVGWYSIKFQKGLDTLGKRYPELISESGFKNSKFPGVRALENQQNARDFFTLLVAMTSDGQKVKQNFALAAGIYDKFRKTGKVPETGTFGGERIASMLRNAKRINQMVEEKGFKGTRDFLLQVKTVGELNKIAAQEKLKFDSGFLVDTTLPMASVVIGDKLGTFYANLMGFDGYVTMDRWFSRTINRYRGDLLKKATPSSLKTFRALLNQPNLTDEETILASVEHERAYRKSGYKDKTRINQVANTVFKNSFGGLNDVPRNKSDRRFMQNVVTNARKRLKKSGINLTEADIQAILWYYEKQLYGELGAVASQEISYEEAADILVNNKKVAPGVNVEGPGGQMTEIYDQDRGLKRGSIQFRNVGRRDQKTIISLFEAADNSTFIHESGHFFLQVMQDVAESAEASDAIKADWQATLDYLGVKSGEDIGVKEHEKWAESFEKYLYEGKAPTIEMEGPFRKFKAWLQSVYKQATGLDIEINDEIRGVFDRLFGTKDEIRLAQEQNEMMALFESPDVMGMDNKQWLEYQEVVRKAAQEAEDDLDQKKLAEVTRQNSKAYQREIKAMEEEVTKEAEAMPIYRVIHFLQTGEDINTKEPLEGMPALKMHTQSLRDTFGPDILSKLPRRRKMHAADGTHHNEIAEMFGFESGLDMITQMQTAQPIKQFIKSQAAERVARDSGALSMNPQKLTEEAVKSIAGSKARGRLLKMQMDMTARKAKIPGTPINVLQEMARQIVANKTISNIHIKQARLAENRAYKAAQKAILEENWFEAHKQMQSQTLNYYVYREAEAAMEDVNKKLRYLDRISKPKHAKKLARDAIDAIYSLLDKVDLRRTRGTRKQTYSAWVQAQQAEGIDVPNAEEMQALLENPDKTHFKDMTYAKFVEFADSVKSIESIARYKQNILVENEKMEFASLVNELVNTARTEYSNKIDKTTDTWVAETPDFRDTKVKSLLQFKGDFLAAHDKMEFVFEAMDGDKTNGVWWNAFFGRLAEAEDRETVMNEQYITALTEIIESKYTLTERKDWQNTVNTRKGRFNKENIISIALNWGNLENQKAVLDGFAGQEQAWDITEADVVTMLNQHMEAKDWQMVQEVWDLIDQLWPEIAALQKKVTGLEPPKVEAAPFKTRFGTMKGGYYPLYYSREFTKKERFRYESTLGDELYDKNSWVVAATRKGHTIARTDSAGQLVRMDLKVLSEHMSNVIHDLTHREAVFYMNRLIKNESIQGAIKGVMGKEVYNKIYPWIRRIANPKPPSYYFVDQVVNYGNTSATMVAMGFKVTTALVQPFGYSQSVAYLGKGWAWQGLMSFYSNPFENKEAIFARSPMMRTRTKSLDRDIREAISDITARDSRLKKIQSKYFYFIGMMDMWVSLPTWQGAYEKAIHEGLSEKDAIAQGDSAVRMTQSSGAVKDLADIQGREDVFYKTFTKFYSYFSAYWNMTRRTKRLSKQGKITKVQAFEQFVWLTVLPATLAEALLGRGPSRDDDDDNDNLTGWSSWALINALTFKFNGMVGVRDLVNAIKHPEFGVQSPWQDMFEMGSKANQNAIDILAGEGNANDWKGLLLGISYAAKLPGRQISNMYEHLVEVFQDGEDFSFYEFMVSVNRND